MPSRCWILGCPSNLDKANTRFFRFPQDEQLKELWVDAIKRDIVPTDSSRICSKHFKSEDIVLTTRPSNYSESDTTFPARYLKLKPGAVPSIFEGLKPRRRRKKCASNLKDDQSAPEEVAEEFSPSSKADSKASPQGFVDTTDLEKSIDTSSTTDKPIITVVKAQDSDLAVDKQVSSDDEVLFTPEKLKSPIIKANSKKIKNDLPSPYKHLPSVSVCLKEEDRVVIPQDEGKSHKRSPSICSNSSNGNSEVSKTLPQPKRRKAEKTAPIVLGRQNDCYCWVCHRENIVLCCIACPRAYHQKCAGETTEPSDWVCPECQRILTAENVDTRSSVLSEISLDRLCALLRFCLNKMKHRAGLAFHQPVSLEHYPMYLHYVIHPMDFSLLEKNIKQKLYGCTEAFLADVKWILHNSCVFNGTQHPLSTNAKTLVKTCENDMQEIEVCPDCFMHSVIRNKYWFADVCRKPHPLVWAKLKGFPYWPAKVVRILDGNVDARFFGAHDRAWVPISQCYHLSKETPTTSKPKKKGNYETALDELNVHVQLLIQKFGTFEYAPCRTTFDPKNKFFVYHGIDIDKIGKEEIPFDPAASANSKEYCASPIEERRPGLESKMDIDQSEEASSNSVLSIADTLVSRISSVDDEKETATPTKDKSEVKLCENNSGKKEDAKQTDFSSNTCDDPSSTKSHSIASISRDKLELALERIKGYVSLDNEDEKESNAKEDEPEKSEAQEESNVSKEGASSILAGLIKSKTLPKIDLPDIPAEEAEVTSKDKTSFLDMSKKNDMFTLHLLETIKRAKSRTAADEDCSDEDVQTLDKEDSDSESVMEEEDDEDEDEDEQEAGDENESDEQEEESEEQGEKDTAEAISASDDDAADESDTESENESSSESSDTDIEEIEMDGDCNSTNKDTEKSTENANNSDSVEKEEDQSDSVAVATNESSSIISCVTQVLDANKHIAECVSIENTEKETQPIKSSEAVKQNRTSDQERPCFPEINEEVVEKPCIDVTDGMKHLEKTAQNKNKSSTDNLEDDDEIIICPPVKPPTPPLICLDDGTETEPENDDKSADAPDKSLSEKSTKPPAFRTIEINKPSAVRVLNFDENDCPIKTNANDNVHLPLAALTGRNRTKRRILRSSSEDSSDEEFLVVNRDRGVPLSGARRTFSVLKKRAVTPMVNVNENDKVIPESRTPPSSNSFTPKSASEKSFEEKSAAENCAINEQTVNIEQDLMSDGSVQDSSPGSNSLTEKDAEILRLKKKLSCLFTAFQLQHWKHTQEKSELRHNMNLIVMEMRASLEADKKQAIETLTRSFERVKQRSIEEVKKNQWCALCQKEARYQCCWNTNYCSVLCQKRNFPLHKNVCAQVKNKFNAGGVRDPKFSNAISGEPRENKKVFVVNMMPKGDAKASGEQSPSANIQQVKIAKSQIQIAPPKSNLGLISSSSIPSTSQLQIVPNANVQYILAPVKPSEPATPQNQVTAQEEKTIASETSDIIKNVRNKNCDLATAVYLLKKKNQESEAVMKKDEQESEQKAGEPDLEELYFPSPPQVSFEGLDTVSPDESVQISQIESSEKNSSDTEILSQGDKGEDSSAEEDPNFSDNDEADNELVTIGHGVDVKAKFLNKCLIYGKTAKRLTRCLVDVLFPDLKLLATCSAFGQKSNVTKLTRAALPAKKVAAILDFVQKRFSTATRTEIVLAINMKCKEARNIVDKQDGEKPLKKNLFRRLLARDQKLEANKTSGPSTSSNTSTTATSSTSPTKTKAPVTTVTVMRQPVNQRICVKVPPLAATNVTESITQPTKLVSTSNILRCSPQVLLRPRFTQASDGADDSPKPRLARQTVRALLSNSQPSVMNASKEPKKILVPLEAFKQSVTVPPTANPTGSSPRPYIIIGTPVSSAPQPLSITQSSSVPTIVRK